MYSYKCFETGKIKRTSGKFDGWTKPTGLMNSRYAIFKRPRTRLFVPEYLLTKETKNAVKEL